ncbi:T9SS type A sorting domain-containing protein [Hymenobacter busanensis]|uniref:T9SS type A sorting domain-containing protein n=1 Tax=Hymenobacter busanensis TaxID=2607656 RepID=UPI0013670109|nr:T9SS type A sorting domain-containing protein [Hymenobacter busanensis]QHJ08482.1 T9SS type A sorting domain-containing protein [Hymenobacter busanensis]
MSQHGDSLRRVLVLAHPNYPLIYRDTDSGPHLRPLRDGGFVFTGVADSLTPGGGSTTRPFVLRVDRDLNVVWRYVHRPLANFTRYSLGSPLELADGSLLVLATRGNNPASTFWLFRFSPAGALTHQYAFTPAGTAGQQVTQPVGLAGLSDSSLMVALNSGTATYTARVRVPGLPRVVEGAGGVPLPARASAGRPLATLALFPNPASAAVTVAYSLPAATRTAALELHDLAGRLVRRLPLLAARSTAALEVRALPPGLYVLTLRAQGRTLTTQKLAVQ